MYRREKGRWSSCSVVIWPLFFSIYYTAVVIHVRCCALSHSHSSRPSFLLERFRMEESFSCNRTPNPAFNAGKGDVRSPISANWTADGTQTERFPHVFEAWQQMLLVAEHTWDCATRETDVRRGSQLHFADFYCSRTSGGPISGEKKGRLLH